MSDRDFKGVWIPKEIWLSKELTLLEKIIYIEIDSLDNENHCTAGNEYFAEFCNCSESKVTKTIRKLKELGMVEEVDFDGRHRKLRVVKSTIEGSKKYEAGSEKVRPISIHNNQDNKERDNSKELSSKEKIDSFLGSGKKKEPKQSLYSKCIAQIDSRDYGTDLHNALVDYLQLRLQIKDKQLYANSWKGLLNKLERDFTNDEERLQSVYQSIERGYASFFPVNRNKKNYTQADKPWNEGVSGCNKQTKEEKEEMERWQEEMRKKGVQVDF